MQKSRKHLKLWGHDASRVLFPLEKEAFSKNKRVFFLFVAKSWGHVHPVPPVPPGSYVYAFMLRVSRTEPF